jgi:mRNA interferase MazF
VRRGEVRWYRFDRPDKKRPVVILTRNSVIDVLAELTVAPVTSRVRDIASEVLLSTVDGIQKHCAVNLDHLHTVPKARLGVLITTLSEEKMEEIRAALLFALEFRQ